jgi:hypothetical protein
VPSLTVPEMIRDVPYPFALACTLNVAAICGRLSDDLDVDHYIGTFD